MAQAQTIADPQAAPQSAPESAPAGAEEGSSPSRELTYIAAITEALDVELARDPNVVIFGEDVAGPFGGAFKVTKPLTEKYPPERIFNTPLAENAFVSMGTGMALMGMRPVIEMQFADFITSAFDSIVQFAASNHYRWAAPVPWVIRAPADGGITSGPFHSQNPEAWFTHTPGLKVLAPATPADAKGLLIAAIRDDNPVIFLEAKILYRSEKGPVPAGEYVVPIGQARVARAGDDLSLISYGAQVRECLKAAEKLAEEGIQAEVLDLRTLKPLDTDAVLATVRKTGKVLIVHSATGNTGVGAEVAAVIGQEAFEWLDAPIQRLTGLDIPVPFSPPLEQAYRPNAEKIIARARALAAF